MSSRPIHLRSPRYMPCAIAVLLIMTAPGCGRSAGEANINANETVFSLEELSQSMLEQLVRMGECGSIVPDLTAEEIASGLNRLYDSTADGTQTFEQFAQSQLTIVTQQADLVCNLSGDPQVDSSNPNARGRP